MNVYVKSVDADSVAAPSMMLLLVYGCARQRSVRPWLYLWALVKLGFKRDVQWLFRRAIRIA